MTKQWTPAERRAWMARHLAGGPPVRTITAAEIAEIDRLIVARKRRGSASRARRQPTRSAQRYETRVIDGLSAVAPGWSPKWSTSTQIGAAIEMATIGRQ